MKVTEHVDHEKCTKRIQQTHTRNKRTWSGSHQKPVASNASTSRRTTAAVTKQGVLHLTCSILLSIYWLSHFWTRLCLLSIVHCNIHDSCWLLSYNNWQQPNLVLIVIFEFFNVALTSKAVKHYKFLENSKIFEALKNQMPQEIQTYIGHKLKYRMKTVIQHEFWSFKVFFFPCKKAYYACNRMVQKTQQNLHS